MYRKFSLVFSVAAAIAFLAVASLQAADRFTVTWNGGNTETIRIMAKKTLADIAVIQDNQQSKDDYLCKASKATDGLGAFAFFNPVPTGTTGFSTANLSVTFKKVGLFEGKSINLATLFNKKKGGAAPDTSGAVLTYNVNVLQQRKLKVANKTLKLGSILRGSFVSNSYQIDSTNKTGTESLTSVKTAQTELADAKGTNNKLTIAAGTISGGAERKYLGVSGLMKDYTEKKAITFTGSKIAVSTNEAASVQDDKPYKPLAVKATADVGIARVVGANGTFKNAKGKDATVLSGDIAAGATLVTGANGGSLSIMDQLNSTPLSSKVADKLKGTLVKYTDYNQLVSTKTKKGVTTRTGKAPLYGLVGSEAAILASTVVNSATTVKMSWRQRTAVEAGQVADTQHIMPSDAKWLTSDVVKIEGIGGDVVYALQMTFDNKINKAMEYINTGNADNGNLLNELQSMYIAQLGEDGKWRKAGTGNANTVSFRQFIENNGGANADLESLVGSWGVDLASSSNNGKGYSWVIVRGSSAAQIFAVAPEPSTIVLLCWAAIGAVAYGVRRYRRK